MLQAVQAAVIYGLLCSQQTELVSNDDAAWLLATIEVRSYPALYEYTVP
jgi:hypothetical protein